MKDKFVGIAKVGEKGQIVIPKEARDMENYAIEVHSLKSDSKYLGFMSLADICYQHELKSKENNIDYINNNFDKLSREFEKSIEVMKKYIENISIVQ